MTAREKLVEWLLAVVIAPHEATSGMPLCPYAHRAYEEGKVTVLEADYSPTPAYCVRYLRWLVDDPLTDVLVVVNTKSYHVELHKRLLHEMREPAKRLGMAFFGHHPEDPLYVGKAILPLRRARYR